MADTRRYGRKGEIYPTADGQWRWRLVASNGEIIANGGEPLHNKAHAIKMVKSMGLLVQVREIQAPAEEW